MQKHVPSPRQGRPCCAKTPACWLGKNSCERSLHPGLMEDRWGPTGRALAEDREGSARGTAAAKATAQTEVERWTGPHANRNPEPSLEEPLRGFRQESGPGHWDERLAVPPREWGHASEGGRVRRREEFLAIGWQGAGLTHDLCWEGQRKETATLSPFRVVNQGLGSGVRSRRDSLLFPPRLSLARPGETLS